MYDKHIDALEAADTAAFTEDQNDALDEAMDCMATVSSINTAMRSNGFDLPEEPDLNKFENCVDSLTCELLVSIMFLCQFAGVEDRLRKVAGELNDLAKEDATKMDPQIINGYLKLADRVERSRQVVDKLVL